MADEIPGLYEMAMNAGTDMNPQTGGPYDPLGLVMGSALPYRQMFDPSGAEDRIRTANTVAANAAAGGGPLPLAPWITQPMQGPQMTNLENMGTNEQQFTAGAPPAYSKAGAEGGVFPGLFNLRAPRTGWFNLQDYYKGAPDKAMEDNPAGRAVPNYFSGGSNRLSTNDWRLLPPQYRNPNYFMINGTIIDRNKAGIELSPASYLGAEAGSPTTYQNVGSTIGALGGPRTFWSGNSYAASGFPGQLSGHGQFWSGG
jgi:hypothetical protein